MTTKTSKILFAAATVMLLTSGAALADLERVRIEHPNGPATYAFRETSKPTTVAVYAGEQGTGSRVTAESARPEKREVVIHQGRGQTQRIQVENR